MTRTFFTGPVIACGCLAAGAAIAIALCGPVERPALLVLTAACFGSIAAAVVTTRWFGLDRFIAQRLFPPARDPAAVIDRMVEYAEMAHADGLQGLGKRLKPGEDHLIRRGISLAAAGTFPDRIREILDAELRANVVRRPGGRYALAALFRAGPMVGLFGLVLCAAALLFSRGTPPLDTLASLSLFVVLMGSLLATLLLGPACEAMARGDAADLLARTIITEGVIAIRAREHPRTVRTRLTAMVPFEHRAAGPAAVAA
jgi:chemotaxis protein MotA